MKKKTLAGLIENIDNYLVRRRREVDDRLGELGKRIEEHADHNYSVLANFREDAMLENRLAELGAQVQELERRIEKLGEIVLPKDAEQKAAPEGLGGWENKTDAELQELSRE